MFNHRGAQLAEIDVEAFWERCGPCLGIARSDLHYRLAKRAAGLHVRLGVTVQALRQHEDHVWVQLSDGSSETYDIVVGADGIRSSVRRLEFGDAGLRFRGQMGWRFIVRRPPHLDSWTVFLGRQCAFLMLPIDHERAYCYADTSNIPSLLGPAQGDNERVQEIFVGFARPVREVLTQLRSSDPIHFSAIEEVAHQCYGRGRVTLIGDAAHAMSPTRLRRCDGTRGCARPGGDRFAGATPQSKSYQSSSAGGRRVSLVCANKPIVETVCEVFLQ